MIIANMTLIEPTTDGAATLVTLTTLVESFVLPVLALAVVLCVIRLVRGPDLANRVIAFDLLSSLGIAVLAAYAVMTDQPAYLDVGLILALVTFMGTVAFSHYMERSPQ